MQTVKELDDDGEIEDHAEVADDREPGRAGDGSATRSACVQVARVATPAPQRTGFLDAPAPNTAPGILPPERPESKVTLPHYDTACIH